MPDVSVTVICGVMFVTTAPDERDFTCTSRCLRASPFMAVIELAIEVAPTITSPALRCIFFASACVYIVSIGPMASVSE